MKAQCFLLSLDVIRLNPTKSFQFFCPVGFGHFCGIGTEQAGGGGGGRGNRRHPPTTTKTAAAATAHTHTAEEKKKGERDKKDHYPDGEKILGAKNGFRINTRKDSLFLDISTSEKCTQSRSERHVFSIIA